MNRRLRLRSRLANENPTTVTIQNIRIHTTHPASVYDVLNPMGRIPPIYLEGNLEDTVNGEPTTLSLYNIKLTTDPTAKITTLLQAAPFNLRTKLNQPIPQEELVTALNKALNQKYEGKSPRLIHESFTPEKLIKLQRRDNP